MCSFASVGLLLSARDASSQQPDYESMVALRCSEGFSRALEAAEAHLSSNPGDGTAAGVRALVYANAVDFLGMAPAAAREAKKEALARAMQIAPTGPWTRAAYGLIHMMDGSVGAERELASCIDEHPAFLECYNLQGDLLRKTGREEQAGAVYRRALKRWPKDGELTVSYAFYLQQAGRVPEALDMLRQLTREEPRFARGHWHLAVMLFESGGDLVPARREASRALELDPLIWNGERFLRMLEHPAGSQE